MPSSTRKRARAAACKGCRIRKRRCVPGSSGPAGPCQLCNVLSEACSLVSYTAGNRTNVGSSAAGNTAPAVELSPPMVHMPVETPSPQGTITNTNSLGVSTLPTATSETLVHQESSPTFPDGDPGLPPPPVVRDLVDTYFRLLHNGPHTLFHEPSFLSELESNTISSALLLAVMSVSARFSKDDYFANSDPRIRGRPYAEKAMNFIQQDLMKPSLAIIQACVLMSQYFGGEGDNNSKHISVGLARVHAQVLRLWDMPINTTVILREVCRRTWLSIVITNKWSATDISTTSVLGEEQEAFPIFDEAEFNNLTPNIDEKFALSQPSGQGFWSQMLRTIGIFESITTLITELCSGKRSLPSEEERIAHLGIELDRWVSGLHERLEYNMHNLSHFSRIGTGKTFLAMHIGYHHFRQLLYFPFLDYRHVRSGNLLKWRYSDLCKEHAKLVSEIAKLAFQNRGCELVYYIIGHILVVSSSIHLHTLLFSETIQEADRARGDLISNFEILMQLKIYWPIIDISVGRLRTFQSVCRSSVSDSFVLDSWMLKFLVETSSVLELERWSERPQTFFDPSLLSRHVDRLENGEWIGGTGTGSLRALVSDQNLSNDALVENALSWLLD